MINNRLKIAFICAGRNALLAVLAVSALQLGNFPMLTVPASAATQVVLASSSLAENYSSYYSLRDYRAFLGPGSVNWPVRSDGCVASGTTNYKTVPWQPKNTGVPGNVYNGDTFNLPGNCATRYVDAGSSSGAWAYPWALGGWTTGTSNAGFIPASAGFTNNFNCNSLAGGAAPMIWGASTQDTSEQAYGAGGLFPQNNWPAVSQGYGLYGNGTTFFRNTFSVPALTLINSNSISLYFQADDWMNVYLNGQQLFSTNFTSVGVPFVIPSSMLKSDAIDPATGLPGVNLLAIQVADKAQWIATDVPSARGSGLCYNLTADVGVGLPYAITPELSHPFLAAPEHLEPGMSYCGVNSFTATANSNAGGTLPYTMSVATSGGASPYAALSPGTVWNEPGFLGAGQKSESFCVSISAAMPDFPVVQQLCFSNTIDPAVHDAAGGLSSATGNTWSLTGQPACLPVYRTRYPYVQGFSGDIHAGGGLCLPGTNILKFPGTNGSVTGNPSTNSFGQYVVSASNLNGINAFGSAGTPGSPTLNFGSAGAYTQVCRADLLTAAKANRPASATNITTTTINTDLMSGVYYFAGPGNLNITAGTVGASVTIIDTDPSSVVRISGNVKRNNGYPYGAKDVPSLGIIAAGNIVVSAGVNQVDAYLFSNGEIDTCEEGKSAATLGQCSSNILSVNGFLMASSISFRRLGWVNGQGSVPGEIVNLSPHIYLNPPKFFDVSVESTLGEGQGERQPLF